MDDKNKEINNKICEMIKKEEIVKIIFSNNKKEKYFKVTVDAIKKNKMIYQFSFYYEDKVKHINIEDNVYGEIITVLNKGYKQCDIISKTENIKILTNKKGMRTLIGKKSNEKKEQKNKHNNVKNYILEEGTKIDFLILLGVMNKDGIVYNNKQKKFRQINKFLEILESIEASINKKGTIVDIGSGKAYLTFATYYYFNVIKNKEVKIIGIDTKKDVIKMCKETNEKLGYNIEFLNRDIKDFEYNKEVELCISLHACNTATDYAIYNSIKWNAKNILAVPCCQKEILKQLNPKVDNLEFILKHGVLKEKMGTILTDSVRSLLLETQNYKSTIIEFIEESNTPKNIMIKGVKNKKESTQNKKEKIGEVEKVLKGFKIDHTLYKLLKENGFLKK